MLWKKRWFVLSEYCLFYYKGQTSHVFLPLELRVAFFPPKNLFHLLPFSLFLSLSFSSRFVFGTNQDTIPNALHATRNSSGFIENTRCFFPFVPPFSLFQVLFSRNSKYERGKISFFRKHSVYVLRVQLLSVVNLPNYLSFVSVHGVSTKFLSNTFFP